MTETLAEHTGRRQPPVLPDADTPIGDKGHDSDRFRGALARRGITPCIPGRASRKKPVACDAELYKQRNLIERMFGSLRDGRRMAPALLALWQALAPCGVGHWIVSRLVV